MQVPLINTLSNGTDTPVAQSDWVAVRDRAVAGDPHALRAVFGAAARWANQLCHRFAWRTDAEADVVAAMWTTLGSTANCNEWRNATKVELRDRRLRVTESLCDHSDARNWEGRCRSTDMCDPWDDVDRRLDSTAEILALPRTPALTETFTLLLTDQPLGPRHSARLRKFRQRKVVA